MKLRRNIKKQARRALEGCWGQARLILLILITLNLCINILDSSVMNLFGYGFEFHSLNNFSYSDNFFFSPIAMLFSISVWLIRLIIIAPLLVGMVGWYLELTDRHRQDVPYIFWPYDNRAWLRAAWLLVNTAFRVAVFGLVISAIPLVLIALPIYLNLYDPLYTLMIVPGWVLMLPAAIAVAVFAQRYAMAPMLLTERHSMTAGDAIRESVKYTKGHCVELFIFELSFLPWLLPVVVVGVLLVLSLRIIFSLLPPMLFIAFIIAVAVTLFVVQPYYTMAKLMYVRYLYEYGKWQEKEQPDGTKSAGETNVNWQPVEDSDESAEVGLYEPEGQGTPSEADKVIWRDIED